MSSNSPTTSTKRPKWRRAAEWLLLGAGTLLLLIGVLFGLFGVVVGRVPEYRVQVQDWLSDRTGLVIEFRGLSARLKMYGPELVFDDAVVRTPDRIQVLATAKRGSVGFDLWSSLRNGQLSAGRFSLRSPQMSFLRTREGRIQLLGQNALAQREGAQPIAVDHLPTGRFEVDDAIVTFRDEFTGRGPWSMSGISFDLTRDTRSVELTGEASLPQGLGEGLEFSAQLTGELDNPDAVVSTFTVSGEQLDLAGWADVFPDAWPAPETGRGSLQISGALRGPVLTELVAHVDFHKLSTALPLWSIELPKAQPLISEADEPQTGEESIGDSAVQAAQVPEVASPATVQTPEMVSYERVAFNARANREENTWTLELSDVDVSRAGSPWRSDKIQAQWTQSEHEQRASLNADRLVLQNLWPVLAYLPESKHLARLRALEASGTVLSVSFDLNKPPSSDAEYVFKAELQNVGFEPIERAPGVQGISGTVSGDQSGGELQLAARDVEFELPRMFRDVLVGSSAEGNVDWILEQDGVTIRTDDLRVITPDGRAQGRLETFVPRDGSSPVLRLSATGEDLNVASTGKYTPAHKLSSRTLAWFDRAFAGGKIVNARVEFDGPTRVFPFRNGEGTFTAQAEIADATFAFHEEWVPATNIAAEASFKNQSMNVHASSAVFGGLVAQNLVAEIRDFKDGEWRISGTSSGDLHNALEFLKASPLAEALGPQLQKVDGEGGLIADVKLFFPMKRMEQRDVTVNARVANGTLTHADVDAPVRALQGTLKIRNTLLASADLKGRWLSGPLNVAASADGSQRSTLIASGRADVGRFKVLAGLPKSIGMSGPADWELTTTLLAKADASRPRTARLTADLFDVEVALPAPIGKQSGEPKTLELETTLEKADRLVARAALGDIRALVNFRHTNNEWRLDRGGIRADAVPASLPAHSGLRFEGKLDHLVLDDWLELKREGTGKPLNEILHAANLRIGTFQVFGYEWHDVRGILQSTSSGWRVDVSGPEAAGQVLIPVPFTGAAPLRATLEHFVLTKAQRKGSKKDSGPTDPRNIPALDVHVSDLRIGARSIGAVDVTASRLPQGLQFDQIQISGSSSTADGRGVWLVTEQGTRSSLAARVSSTDVAATLASLDYTPFLEATRGEIRADLSWPSGFDDNILEQASGRISVRAEEGQIVNLQPGAGRMLGLFSVAALPRRLALDFSDLTDKGLAFDVIQGDFDLREGNAYTNNLLLRGPAAEIGIAGRTGFGARDYDQTAVVTGNLGASLPVAGALAGGPAVGAALLLFSQVFKEPLKGMTRGYYRITGPWDNPTVERVDASDAKDATAHSSRRSSSNSAAKSSNQ